MQPSERKNHNKSFCANVSQLLNKAKDCQKCKILLEIGKQRNSVGDMNLQENLVVSERDSSVVVSRENECEVLMSQMSQ